MGFKKDLKRAKRVFVDSYKGEPPMEFDAFCWDLIQRLNEERLSWKESAAEGADGCMEWFYRWQDAQRQIIHLRSTWTPPEDDETAIGGI